MSALSVAPMIVAAAEEPTRHLPNHWLVGGTILVVLALVMLALLAFGAGRDHT